MPVFSLTKRSDLREFLIAHSYHITVLASSRPRPPLARLRLIMVQRGITQLPGTFISYIYKIVHGKYGGLITIEVESAIPFFKDFQAF